MPKIHSSPFPPTEIRDESIYTYLLNTHHHKFPPTSPAYIDAPTGKVITRGELRDLTLSLASGLRQEFPQLGGIQLNRGDTIMIFSPNSIAWPVIMFGCFAAGIKPTLANSAYTAREVEHQWKDSTAKAVFAHPTLVPIVLETFAKLGFDAAEARRRLVVADWPERDESVGPFVHMGELIGKGSFQEEEKFPGEQAHETTVLCYSSGTTGNPKGVETTHRNLTTEVAITEVVFPEVGPDDVFLGVLPFYHVYGAVHLLMLPLYVGVPVVIQAKFDFIEFCRYIEKYRISIVLVVPPICLALARHPATAQFKMNTLRLLSCGAAPLGAPLVADLRKRLASLGATPWISQGYGSTETSPASHIMNWEDCWRKQGSIGKLLPNLEARLVADDGGDAEVGKPGELWVRGPTIMKGYLNNPTATKNTITQDGFYKTGDVAVIDDEGFYYIVDRLKELIKYKGFQVPPAELESILLQHPDIADTAVIGIQSEKEATELPRAYVVHAQGRASTDTRKFGKEVQKWMESRVARHKFLRGGVSVIDVIPRSAAGKILRRELRELAKREALEDPELNAKL